MGDDAEVPNDPNQSKTDPVRLSIAMGKLPPVLFEGWFYKKMHGRAQIPVVGQVLDMIGAGWKKRYVRLFPGKLEWYKDETPAALAKPLGFGPLGVLRVTSTPPKFERIQSTIQTNESSAPSTHKRCLRISFNEAGEVLYRIGMGAHHGEYLFSPDDEAKVHEFEMACDEAAYKVDEWGDEVMQAAIAAAKKQENPLNAALAVIAEKT